MNNDWLTRTLQSISSESQYLDRLHADRSYELQQQLLNTLNRRFDQSEEYVREKEQQYLSIGENYRPILTQNLANRIQQGEITAADAQSRLQSYFGQYPGMDVGLEEFDNFTNLEKEYAPINRERDIAKIYKNYLGRTPAEGAEKDTLLQNYGLGNYSINQWASEGKPALEKYIQDLTEYKKDKPTATQQEYISKYGEGLKDEEGLYTNEYRLNLGTSFLPSAEDAEKLEARTGIKAPDFFKTGIIEGSADAIEMAKGRLNAYDSFMYSSGLAQLEGNIKKEQTKMNNDAQLRLAKLNNQFGMMNQIIGAF